MERSRSSAPTSVRLASGVEIDPLKMIDSRWLVCGNSGSGKSWMIRRFLEQVVGKIPTIVLDREGEFATLREKFDVVLVGSKKAGADVETSVSTAAKLARRLVELRVSAVIDLSELSKQDQRKFVRIFLETLINKIPRELWAPMFVVLDEAHEFCPETGREAESSEAVISLMAQGRKRGIGGILATQRLAKLSKDAVSEANNLCIGRHAQDVDMRRASDLLGFSGKSEWETIRKLKAGEFYGYGPAFKNPDTTKFHVDKVITTHPKAGQRHRLTMPRPSKTILKVVPELAELQQKIEEEKNELLELRAKVKELSTKKFVQVTAKKASPEELAAARERGYNEGVRGVFSTLKKSFTALRSMATALPQIASAIEAVEVAAPTKAVKYEQPKDPPSIERIRKAAPEAKPRAARANANPINDKHLGRGAPTKVLTALLMYQDAITRGRAALLAGIPPESSTLRNAISKLRVMGLLEDVSDQIMATDEARQRFPDAPKLPTGDELIEHWKSEMGTSSAPGKLFSVLVDTEGPIDREQAAKQAGLEFNSTFRNAASKLRVMGLLVDHGRDQIAIHPELK